MALTCRIFLIYALAISLAASPCYASHEESDAFQCPRALRKLALFAVAPITDLEKYVYILGPPVGLSFVFHYPKWIAFAYVAGYFLYKSWSKQPVTGRGVLNYLLNLRLVGYDFAGKRILDVGSGYSRFAQVIDLIYRKTETEAYSIDKKVKPRGRHSVKGDALDLPFDDGFFDLVVSSWAFIYWYEHTDGFLALNQMLRVAGPGGQIRLRVYRPTDRDLTIDYLAHHPAVQGFRYLRNAAFLTERVLVIDLKEEPCPAQIRETYHRQWLEQHKAELKESHAD